jgi:hypothetical protein
MISARSARLRRALGAGGLDCAAAALAAAARHPARAANGRLCADPPAAAAGAHAGNAATTPWWLMVLRLLMAALVILALARPIWSPQTDISTDRPLLLLVDDGWRAGAGAERIRAGDDHLA